MRESNSTKQNESDNSEQAKQGATVKPFWNPKHSIISEKTVEESMMVTNTSKVTMVQTTTRFSVPDADPYSNN